MVILAFSTGLAPHASAESGQTAGQVADQIVAVQAQADEVAAQWVQRDGDAKQLATDVAAAIQAVSNATATTQTMGETLTKMAVDRYTGSIGSSFLSFSTEVMAEVEKSVLSRVAANSGADDLDAFRSAEADLRVKQQQLQILQAQNSAAVTKLDETQTVLDTKLAELTALESKLIDAEVQQAYEARLAELRVNQAADARAAQATLLAKQIAPVVRGGGATEPTTSQPSPTAPATPAKSPPTPVPKPPAATSTTSSPVAKVPATPPALPPQTSIGGLVCPVAGPNAFGDTWGDPRPGGRHHEGVDMMSPQGTPLVAVISGNATMNPNALGGMTVGLEGSDGNYYYYAHLSAWEGSSRAVNRGEVVGYVGHTGDTSANHLHFGIYAGGGPAINPYPIVRQIC
jgi:murein DD-endopeptidase MepM/ murein hydrolase activator NlpD